MQRPLLFLYLIFIVLATQGQTYTGGGGLIPDNGSTGNYYLNVLGMTPQNIDTIHGLESVGINIMHPSVGELKIEVISPDGSVILLTESLGGDGDNFTSTYFRDDVEPSIYNGIPPYMGDYRPLENVGYLNNGQNGNGTWTLRILDMAPGSNAGTLMNWTLKFSSNPGVPFPFDSTNLPIVMIDTHGQAIPDDPKILVGMKIIDNGAGNFNHVCDSAAYDYYAGIEVRGSSSQMFLKKSYGFETWDSLKNPVDTSLLGMPKESDWILNANFSDKTLLRNTMAYQYWMDLGHYATRYRHVEVFLNNRYKGVYVFSEKIKRDKHRVDIAKLTPTMNSGDSLTGGYIFKIDKTTGSGGGGWASNFPPPVNPNGQYIWFQYEYPKVTEITSAQQNYIQQYVYNFETTLSGPWFADTVLGFRHFAVEETFYDYFIVNEFSKNVDGYRLSTFLHKERDSLGGKLRMGPVWDYDLAWHNADYCGGDSYQGWAYRFPCAYDWWQIPFWWQRLLQDTLYANHLNCRWQEARGSFLSNESVNTWIDSMAAVLDAPQQRNFTVWPILGIYVWPNPWPYPTTYGGEIASLKSWISDRLSWLDDSMPGHCWTTGIASVADRGRLVISPNPAASFIVITGFDPGRGNPSAEIFSILGQTVLTKNHCIPGNPIDISRLAPGSYSLRIRTGSQVYSGNFIKIM
jgi:subtilisin-like proprotein convertase family protein